MLDTIATFAPEIMIGLLAAGMFLLGRGVAKPDEPRAAPVDITYVDATCWGPEDVDELLRSINRHPSSQNYFIRETDKE